MYTVSATWVFFFFIILLAEHALTGWVAAVDGYGHCPTMVRQTQGSRTGSCH
jgi:hypothetical protein